MPAKYQYYTAKEIKPSGWLRQQLMIQLQGLSGNLDQIWPDIRDSAWIGGKREGWERVPYWLDGAIPLAYLLEDEKFINRVNTYVDAILKSQNSDGWICPCKEDERESYDIWALLLITKVLVVYYECTEDERIPDVVYRSLKNYYKLLESGACHLDAWGKARWFEGFIALNWLYDRRPEPWMIHFAHLLKEQGLDYPSLSEEWKRPLNEWKMTTHVVNLAMMLKYEAVSCDLLGEPYTGKAKELLDIIQRYNGTPVGTFTGDECLSGLSPIQGTELCAVVEQMYSYELLYAYTGDTKWAELLEKLAFNALPATVSEDMWTHQYVQMSNQINCVRFPGKSLFRTNSSESHLFGLEPNFGCCTANFNQGWPKFALAAFLHDNDRTIENAIPVPSVLRTKVNGTQVEIFLDTEYPFRNHMQYRICVEQPISMRFQIRVPSFAERLKLNGETVKKQAVLIFDQMFEGVTELSLDFEVEPRLVARPYQMKTAQYGSLVFSLPLKATWNMQEYEKDGVVRKYPYCDYELRGTSQWNYAFAAEKLRVEQKEGDDIPFSSSRPRLVLRTDMVPIDWGMEEGYETVCAKVPAHRTPIGQPEEKELYPYGCSKLRITEAPLIH